MSHRVEHDKTGVFNAFAASEVLTGRELTSNVVIHLILDQLEAIRMAHRDALLQVLPPLPNNNTKHATTTTTNTNHAAAAAATTTTTINASPATGSTTTSIASATAATLITTTTKLVDRQKHRPFRRSSAGRRRADPARICLEAGLVAFGRRFGFPASALKGMDGFKGQMEGAASRSSRDARGLTRATTIRLWDGRMAGLG